MRQTTCERRMATETPLDVLSRAASLIDTNEVSENSQCTTTTTNNCKSIVVQDNEISSLKLASPIKSLKQRRKKRRDQEYFSTRAKARRTAGTQTSVSLMAEVNMLDEKTNRSPVYVSCKDASDCDDSYDEQDSDTPLDMTVRNRKSTEDESKESSSDSEALKKPRSPFTISSLQQRPSVITCTSNLQHTPSRTVNYTCSTTHSFRNNTNEEARFGHRREVLSGMCDPVIDEHFRRSLGKDYPEFFSNLPKSNTVSVCGLSVDDHFSKALGDTWLKLKEKSCLSNTPSTTSRSADLSKTSTSPLLQVLI